MPRTAAWQRKEGKSKSGGLNRKGVASYRAANPGSKLKTAVTTKPLYKALMIFLDFPSLTKNVPIIEVNIQAPPIDKG